MAYRPMCQFLITKPQGGPNAELCLCELQILGITSEGRGYQHFSYGLLITHCVAVLRLENFLP
jgi:hypothetical protein